MSIFMSKFAGDDYSAMQGPCPDGFHIPTSSELQNFVNLVTSSIGITEIADLQNCFKVGLSGRRLYDTAVVNSQGVSEYWLSCELTNNNPDKCFFYSGGLLFSAGGDFTTRGFSIRPFKDISVTPDSSWTALYSDKIYWSSILGLISISGDGSNWITIADKNLGATTVWSSGDTLSQANCGKYYQRGNNYGFPRTGSVTTSSAQVNASTYGPGNYYSSSTFIIRTVSPYGWDSSDNGDLWGGETGVVQTTGEPKKIYIRVDDPFEPYTPNANTILYCPLKTAVTDEGPNHITMSDYDGMTFGTFKGIECSTGGYTSSSQGAYNLTSSTNLTASLWCSSINTNTSLYPLGIFRYNYSSGYGFILREQGNSGFVPCLYTDSSHSLNGTTPLNDGNWHNLIYTYTSTGTLNSLYVDGVLAGSFSDAFSMRNNNMTFAIGIESGTAFSGYISEVIFEYDTRDATKIANYYENAKAHYGN